MKEFKRISVPLKFKDNIDHLLKPENPPIISCKNRRLNFYPTTPKLKWDNRYLASNSWVKMKTYGDFFQINAISKLPAWDVKKCTFSELGLSTDVVNALKENRFLYPTNIQISTIPTILSGFNTILGGETGGGKTVAYTSPILNSIFNEIRNERNSISPKALIVAPSWELCTQINKVISSLGSSLGINCTVMRSNEDIDTESDIVISTPHTMDGVLKSGQMQVNKLKSLVLDEADMVLDKSFNDITRNILSQIMIQNTRPIEGHAVGTQLILCNATCPMKIEEEFGRFVPIDTFSIIKANALHKLIPSVSHKFFRLKPSEKPSTLIRTLKDKGLNSCPFTIVFCNNIDSVQDVSKMLSENAIDHVSLYKDIALNERLNNLDNFLTGKVRVLVSTDLGSRGLDTINATHVINYEFPRFISDYLHRTGRIGRVGSAGSGKVTNFISSKREINAVQIIEKAIRLNSPIPNIDGKRQITIVK